jgi:hypothetical protein
MSLLREKIQNWIPASFNGRVAMKRDGRNENWLQKIWYKHQVTNILKSRLLILDMNMGTGMEEGT